MTTIGIRKEDKNRWERRVPITPKEVGELRMIHGIGTQIQSSSIRAFTDEEYRKVGAEVVPEIPDTTVVFAVKEIPIDCFKKGHAYVFFAHVIKGQKYNMPMLKRMMDLGCTLIDYEKITDVKGKRLVFFGKEAGQAGMIDTLWALGKRLEYEGLATPFSHIRKTVDYHGLNEALEHLREIGNNIEKEGLPEELCPLIVGFAGYGNVSQGAQEIFDILPHEEIQPENVATLKENGEYSRNLLYKVVFKEQNMVRLNGEGVASKEEGMVWPKEDDAVSKEENMVGSKEDGAVSKEENMVWPKEDDNETFDLQDYYDHPERYVGIFNEYTPHLTVLMNCIYWDARYPRLVTKAQVKELYSEKEYPTFRIVGDISCDYEGSIEVTIHSTDSDYPTFIYDPFTDTIVERGLGPGLTIMAVDNLPAELPRESSTRFSQSLLPFIPSIAKADYLVPFHQLDLPPEVMRAVILYQGELTPDYQYIQEFLEAFE